MTKDMMLEEEALKLVNGGILQEGWEETLISMMALYKGKFGETGKQMMETLFVKENIGGGPLEEADLPVIRAFINDNWDTVTPKPLP